MPTQSARWTPPGRPAGAGAEPAYMVEARGQRAGRAAAARRARHAACAGGDRVPAVRRRACVAGLLRRPRHGGARGRAAGQFAAARAQAVHDDGGLAGGGFMKARRSRAPSRRRPLRGLLMVMAAMLVGVSVMQRRSRGHRLGRMAGRERSIAREAAEAACAMPSATSLRRSAHRREPARAAQFTEAGAASFVDGCGRAGSTAGCAWRQRRRHGSAGPGRSR
jgi:hypothetical protein